MTLPKRFEEVLEEQRVAGLVDDAKAVAHGAENLINTGNPQGNEAPKRLEELAGNEAAQGNQNAVVTSFKRVSYAESPDSTVTKKLVATPPTFTPYSAEGAPAPESNSPAGKTIKHVTRTLTYDKKVEKIPAPVKNKKNKTKRVPTSTGIFSPPEMHVDLQEIIPVVDSPMMPAVAASRVVKLIEDFLPDETKATTWE
jgi:hypothetical protein